MGFMNIHETIKFLDKQIPNPSLGLPEEVVLFHLNNPPSLKVVIVWSNPLSLLHGNWF